VRRSIALRALLEVLLLQRNRLLSGGLPQAERAQLRLQRILLERLRCQPHHVLRLVDRQRRAMYLPREHRELLTAWAIPSISALAGIGGALLIGRSPAQGLLLALFLSSSVLVGLAQQTLP
jgi:hypothetical protein